MANKLDLTRQQEDELCYIIGEWYLKWKDKIAPGRNFFGIAKEDLKMMFCKDVSIDDHISNLWVQAKLGIPDAYQQAKELSLAMVGLTEAIGDKNDTDNNAQIQDS